MGLFKLLRVNVYRHHFCFALLHCEDVRLEVIEGILEVLDKLRLVGSEQFEDSLLSAPL